MIKENFEILGFWSSIFKEKICDGTTIFQELLKVLALKKRLLKQFKNFNMLIKEIKETENPGYVHTNEASSQGNFIHKLYRHTFLFLPKFMLK